MEDNTVRGDVALLYSEFDNVQLVSLWAMVVSIVIHHQGWNLVLNIVVVF